MDPDRDQLEAQLASLREGLARVEERLDALERHASAPGARRPASPAAATAAPAAASIPPLIPPATVALVGRTLVVLGGAYLLRALSDRGLLPAAAGAAVGLLYAVVWLLQADRTAAAGQRLSALFHGLAAVLIAYPLIWETTARFGILAPGVAAGALVAFFALALLLAARRDLVVLAWTVSLFGIAATLGLLVGTRSFLPFTFALLLFAAVTEGLAYRDRWLALRWPVALAVDLALVMLMSTAVSPNPEAAASAGSSHRLVIAACLALPLLYVVSAGARTLLRERLVTPFEVVQLGLALLIGFGSAVRVIAFGKGDPTGVGLATLLLGVACYAAAFVWIDRRTGRGPNFYAYTTFGGLLVLTGCSMILAPAPLALSWSALALAGTGLGVHFQRITLRYHGAIYATAATAAAGVLACSYRGLLGAADELWSPVSPAGWVATASAALSYGVLAWAADRPAPRWFDALPSGLVGAALLWSLAGVASGGLRGSLDALSGAPGDAAFLAAGRSAVLAVLAVMLAWAGRRWSLRELTWLVYPVLLGGGAKLLWEDFRVGHPLTLFIALALYGGALIVTPRLVRREP